MASTKSFMMARRATNYRFLTDPTIKSPHALANSVEFDESDVWGGSNSSESTDLRTPSSSSRKPITRKYPGLGDVAASLPVNVPDWSKILRDEYRDRWDASAESGGSFDYGGDDENEEWVPPHEYLARTRNASFSMQEGIGRTLKGRDLSMVRDAIWEITGFQD